MSVQQVEARPYGSQTITEEQPAPFVNLPVVAQNGPPDYRQSMENLIEIAFRYPTWDDQLSRRLHRWVLTVIPRKELPSNYVPTAEECTVLQSRVDELATEILVNPFFGALLQDPVLVDQRTIGRRLFEDYSATLSACGPQADLPNPVATKDHLFATAMLQWVRPLLTQQSVERAKVRLAALEGFLSMPPSQVKLALYGHHVQMAIRKDILREELRQPLEDLSLELVQQRTRLEREIEAQRQAITREIEEQNRHIEERIDGIQQTGQAIIHGLEVRVEMTEADLRARQQLLETTQGNLNQSNARIARLEADVLAKEAELRDLRDRANSGSGGCTLL